MPGGCIFVAGIFQKRKRNRAARPAVPPFARKKAIRQEDLMEPVALLFSVVAIPGVALFSFLAVAVWAGSRRKEREAYYRSEVLKKIAEAQGSGSATALELMREDQRAADHRRREGTLLGGLVLTGVGLALMVFLKALISDAPVYLCGLMPLFIGFALLGYSYFLAPKV
jgi:hypothetical protein